MDIIKKLFCFNGDEQIAIGLCKFNDSFYKSEQNKQNFRKKVSKDINLSQMLKRTTWEKNTRIMHYKCNNNT